MVRMRYGIDQEDRTLKYFFTALISLAAAWGITELSANYAHVMHLVGLNLSTDAVQTGQFALLVAAFCSVTSSICFAVLWQNSWTTKDQSPPRPPLCGKCLTVGTVVLAIALVFALVAVPTAKVGYCLWATTNDYRIFLIAPGIPVALAILMVSVAIIMFTAARHKVPV